MLRDDDVGHHADWGRNVCNAASAKYYVDAVYDEGGADVTDDRREEDKGDFGVGKLVVGFELEDGEEVSWNGYNEN